MFVKNLPETMTEEKLREMFSEHGEVRPPPPSRMPTLSCRGHKSCRWMLIFTAILLVRTSFAFCITGPVWKKVSMSL